MGKFKEILKEEAAIAAKRAWDQGANAARVEAVSRFGGVLRDAKEESAKPESTYKSVMGAFAGSLFKAARETAKFAVSAFVDAGKASLYNFALRSALRAALRA